MQSRLRFSITSVLAVFITTAITALCLAHDAQSRLDEAVPLLLLQNQVPSVSIAQIKDGAIVRTSAYGRQGASIVATPNTLYNVASLAKPISAETVLRLVSKGTISLDEPMSPYWTDPDIAKDDRHKLLTPRIALSHQTGFANWRSETGNLLTFRNDPGAAFGYSGEGFEYLARFVEKKTAVNLEEHARDLIFIPANMRSTAYTRQPWFEGRVAIPADAAGQWLIPTFASKPVASDLLYTTAADYGRFLIHVMKNEGLLERVAQERSSVQISLRERMCRPIKPELCPAELGMGLGWQVLRFKNKTILMHTGRDPGVYTFTYLCPTTGAGAVLLTNGENGNKIIVPLLKALDAEPEFLEFLISSMPSK
jgi:CubicO group peptidase (beta-lactamase class C family)